MAVARGLTQSGFEIGDAQVGGGELARAVQHVLLEYAQAVRGVAVAACLFAQPVDLGGPAILVGLLAVLGEAGAFKRRREFGLQFCDFNGEGRPWLRRSRGLRRRCLVEEAIDAADAAR